MIPELLLFNLCTKFLTIAEGVVELLSVDVVEDLVNNVRFFRLTSPNKFELFLYMENLIKNSNFEEN